MKLDQLFEQGPNELHALASLFKREFDSSKGVDEWGDKLSTLASEPGACSMVSHTFKNWLANKGVKSSFIVGSGAKDPSWKHPDDDNHTVVKIGSYVIDFTARQFDKSLPFPRIIPVDQFKQEWSTTE